MYYEVHGAGEPLVVLHGAYMTIGAWVRSCRTLARTRQVVAVELQGHGHTADVDRPLSYEQMADDVAALLRHLGIEKADVFGYSMGGGVALQVAMPAPGGGTQAGASLRSTYDNAGVIPRDARGDRADHARDLRRDAVEGGVRQDRARARRTSPRWSRR